MFKLFFNLLHSTGRFARKLVKLCTIVMCVLPYKSKPKTKSSSKISPNQILIPNFSQFINSKSPQIIFFNCGTIQHLKKIRGESISIYLYVPPPDLQNFPSQCFYWWFWLFQLSWTWFDEIYNGGFMQVDQMSEPQFQIELFLSKLPKAMTKFFDPNQDCTPSNDPVDLLNAIKVSLSRNHKAQTKVNQLQSTSPVTGLEADFLQTCEGFCQCSDLGRSNLLQFWSLHKLANTCKSLAKSEEISPSILVP